MLRLRKVLSDSSKDIRHRRNLINIHITFLGWLVEFIGFFLIMLGSFVLGSRSPLTTLFLQTLTIIIYFNILPLAFLINDPDIKANMAETKNYLSILQFFNIQHNNKIEALEDEKEEDNQNQGRHCQEENDCAA